MTKVRQSQIPEDNKTYFPNRKSPRNKKVDYEMEDDEDDFFDSEEDEPKDPTKNVICRVMIEFGRTMLNIYQVQTIDRFEEFVEKPEAHWEYGIVINQGFTPSVQTPKTDIKQMWENEAGRDRAYEKLKEILEHAGILILKIE